MLHLGSYGIVAGNDNNGMSAFRVNATTGQLFPASVRVLLHFLCCC